MSDAFLAAAEAQRKRYPLAGPQDLGKFAYQNEFGPEHMVTDRMSVVRHIAEEWEMAEHMPAAQEVEWIGNGLARFHLTHAYTSAQAASLLAELFLLTARTHRGSRQGLEQKLALLDDGKSNGMREWLAEYRAQGCPTVRHSEVFRRAYHPHYRVLKAEYACYFPVLLKVWQMMAQNKRVVVAIDGRCGSGKTRLAQTIASVFPCSVFHMDDFYLPPGRREADWQTVPAGNMDLRRFRQEVLLPAQDGAPVCYRAYSCAEDKIKPAVHLTPQKLVVVEGSYSQHPFLADAYDLKIFLTCSRTEQHRRLLNREGEHIAGFTSCWIPMEERYFRTCGIQKNDVMTVDTSAFFRA